MGLFDRGGQRDRPQEYIELEVDKSVKSGTADRQVHIAAITEQRDVIAIQDAVHQGDVVLADLATLTTSGPKVDHIIDELRQTAEELGGDIVKKGDDQLIITPSGVSISRRKLGAD